MKYLARLQLPHEIAFPIACHQKNKSTLKTKNMVVCGLQQLCAIWTIGRFGGAPLISLQKRFLFIHIPKTGGNSIQNVLRNYSEDKIVTIGKHQDGVERFEVRNDHYAISKHSTLPEYREVIDQETFRQLYKFATVRNPWDMMISFYFSPHRQVDEWDRDAFLNLLRQVHPVRHYISTADQLDLGREMDFIIRFEQLNEDFAKICNQLELPLEDLPVRNKSNRKHYAAYYDEELVGLVRKKFHEEIEFGHYEFNRENRHVIT